MAVAINPNRVKSHQCAKHVVVVCKNKVKPNNSRNHSKKSKITSICLISFVFGEDHAHVSLQKVALRATLWAVSFFFDIQMQYLHTSKDNKTT